MYNNSIVKQSNSSTIDEPHKKELDISRLKHNEINFAVTFEGPPNYSKIALQKVELV